MSFLLDEGRTHTWDVKYPTKKYETTNILCFHVLKVFEENDVKVVIEKYILKRGTRECCIGIIHDVKGKEVEEDPKLSSI
ncbi:hypothetical protein CR513_11047, partial [Mucuna pruriens]